MLEYFTAALSEGDTTSHGEYELRYDNEYTGSRGGRHVIEAHHPEDGKVARLEWMGLPPYAVHNITVEPEHRRRGLATAMWNWAQENARPKPRHSEQRTDSGDAWARSVGGRLPRRKARRSEAQVERSFPINPGYDDSASISDYFGGGHGGAAPDRRVAGRGKPRSRQRPGGQGGSGGAPAAPGGGAGGAPAGQQRGEADEGGGRLEGPRPVEFHPGAHKDLKALDRPVQKQIKGVIDALANGEQGLQTHALSEKLKGWYSTKASRGHRVVHRNTDDGGIHIGYVGLHDYDKAIRRLTKLTREPGPVSFPYLRNTEGAPNLGSMYGQDVEPHGRYLRYHDGPRPEGDRWETGTASFENPLHLDSGGNYGDPSNWKHQLSSQFGGKKGKALSRAVVKAGHDAIITHDEYGPDEIVDLTSFKKTSMRKDPIQVCPCGMDVVFDPQDGWQHADGSVSHDGEFYGRSVSDLMKTARIGEERYDPDDGEYARLWDRWHPQLQPEMHRHLSVRLPGDHPAHDDRLPMHERAQAVLDRVSEGSPDRPGSLGWHWTDDPSLNFLTGRLEPGHTPVVVHAQTPPREHIEDNGWTLREDRAVKDWDHPEREVPLKRNAPVHVTGVSWRPAGKQMVRHDFEQPIVRQAAHPLPTSRVFGPTYGLDHRLFTGEKLKPEVRTAVLARLGPVIEPLLGEDWKRYTKVYLAGSEASEWTSEMLEGNGDFDTLIGVDYDALKGEPGVPLAAEDDQDITDALNKALREDYNASPWKAPFGGDWDLTGYCNAGSYDIRRIKPYAAYNITDDEWSVRPPHLPDWSIEKLPEGGDNLLAEAEGYAAVIEAISKMPEPFRTQQGKALWKHLHSDRGRAFSDEGEGWLDPGNLIEKALVEWGLWDRLVEWQYGKKTAAYDGPPVEHVRVDKLLPHREWQHQRGGFSYDMEGDGPYAGKHDAESWDANKRSVAEQGIQHPLTLEYNPTTHSAYLGEGNHRLHWAHELGHETVPVRMWRTSKDMPERYRIQGEPKLTKDENGYFPQDGFKPSDVLPADYFPSRGKTAGAHGDLPEGLTFRHEETPYQHQITAETPDDGEIGYLFWSKDEQPAGGKDENCPTCDRYQWDEGHKHPAGEIEDIDVVPAHRRKGVGRAMLQHARSLPVEPKPVHSDVLTDEGRAWMEKNAGARGDLPDLTFRHLPPKDNHPYGGADQDTHTLHVYTRDGKHAGELSWFGEDGMIRDVGVHPDYRRRGIASELLHRARQIQPDVHHSDALTSDGAGWARKVSMLEYFAVKRSDHPLAPDLPQEQHDALDTENWSEHKRKMLDLAKNPVPGTHIWRGEVRAQEPVKSARETGVGIHWGVNPDTILRPQASDGEHEVVYHAEIEHPGEQNFSRSHSMWHGRHMSLDSEAEVRLKPGTRVKLHGVWYRDPYVSERGPFSPTKPERMGKQWSYTPINEYVEVAHRPTTDLIDYSDVGVKHEGMLGYFTAAEDDEDYRMQHRPADEEYGAPLHDLTHNGMLPDDVYTHPHYYDYGGEGMGSSFGESYRHILRTRGNPEARVKIYRSLPAEHAHQGFRPGDWVSTSKEYARQHGRQTDPQHDWPVISTVVRAKHLWTEGNDLREYGYTGPHKDMPMVSFKGGYHQEIRNDKDGWIKSVKRRKPKTAMPARHHPPTEGFSHHIEDLDPTDNDHAKQEEDWPGWNHRILYGKINGQRAGHIIYSENPKGTALSVGKMETYRNHRGKGLASAMQDALVEEHPRHWINHGSRTGAGQSWWESYDDPAPDRNIHNFPREQWERDFEVPGGHGEEFDRKFGTDERSENQEGAQESRPEPSRPRPQRRVRSVWGSSVAHLSPQDHADSLMSPTREHANKVLQGMGPVKWAEHHSHAERDAISSLDEARTTSRPGTKPVGVLVRKQGDQITGVQLKHHGGDLPEGHMFAGIDIPGFGAIHDLSDDPRPVRKQASMSDYFGMAA